MRASSKAHLLLAKRAVYVGNEREQRAEIEIDTSHPRHSVLPNDHIDSHDFPKVQRALDLLEPFAREPFEVLEAALKRMLADRERPPLEDVPTPQAESPLNRDMLRELSALCIRTPFYGTRSSTIVALSPGKVSHYCTPTATDSTQFAG